MGLLIRIALAGATARALFQVAGYFLQRFDVRRHHVESSLIVVAALALGAWFVGRETEEPPARLGVFPAWRVLGGTLIGAFVLYWPALRVGFLSDDFVLADRALRGEFVASTHEFVRPVPLLIWRLLFISGAGATVIHLLNVILHGVNAALTARLARGMGATHASALAAALLFLIWPTQVESVTWGSGVFDVLMTTLVLALVNVYAAGVRAPSPGRVAAVLVLTVLAILTKETAAAIPALLLILSALRWPTAPPSRRELAVFAAVTLTCAGYMFWRVILRPSASASPHPSLTRYGVKELLSRTFGTLAVPLTAEWSANVPPVAAALACVVICFAVLPLVTRRRQLESNAVAALIWPAVAAAPALGYLFIGPNLEGSRYLYLPMAGWAIFLGVTAHASASLWRGMLPIVAVCGIVVAGASILQSRALLEDWTAAAAHRDLIVAAAKQSLDRASCRRGHFAGAPESYKGAHLFKNGLDEAVRSETLRSTNGATDGEACEFAWNGNGFVRQ